MSAVTRVRITAACLAAFALPAASAGAGIRFGVTAGPQLTQLVARDYDFVGRSSAR